jgi:hypothetical protein
LIVFDSSALKKQLLIQRFRFIRFEKATSYPIDSSALKKQLLIQENMNLVQYQLNEKFERINNLTNVK